MMQASQVLIGRLVLNRMAIPLTMGLIIALALVLRSLRLLNTAYYYIYSPDSHWFNWMADMVQSGQTHDPVLGRSVSTLHSGLTYPLACTARALRLFGLDSADALSLAGKLLPLLLAILSLVTIYFIVSRIYDRRIALLSCVAWAFLPIAIYVEGSGYLDRDGLSMLLIIIGASLFYLSRGWHWRRGRADLGWLIGALAVCAVSGILYAEWLWLGPTILIAIVGASFASEALVRLYRHVASNMDPEETDPFELALGIVRVLPAGLVAAVRQSPWKQLAVILVLHVLFLAIGPGFGGLFGQISYYARDLTGSSTTGELQGLGLLSLWSLLVFLIIPILIGIYAALRRRRRADLFFVSWAAILFLAGMFAIRLFLFAAPALCVLCGLGLAWLLEPRYPQDAVRYAKLAVVAGIVLVTVVLGIPSAYANGAHPRATINTHWLDALTYLREDTPEDAVVMTWWDSGYWVLDVARRSPVADNGLHSEEQDTDIATVYCSTEVQPAIEIMQKYEASYLVFSETDIAIMPIVSELGLGERLGDGQEIPWEMQDSLFAVAIRNKLDPAGGLVEVYRNDQIVILRIDTG